MYRELLYVLQAVNHSSPLHLITLLMFCGLWLHHVRMIRACKQNMECDSSKHLTLRDGEFLRRIPCSSLHQLHQ